MKTFAALLKREWLENTTGFGWAPLGVLGFLAAITLLGLLMAGNLTIHTLDDYPGAAGAAHGDQSFRESMAGFADFKHLSDEQLADRLAIVRTAVAKPFQLVFFLVLTFMLLGALHDERRDRSVLFWKSMPVTDLQSVASKLVLGVWIAPLVTIAAIVAAQLFMLFVISGVSIAEDLGSVGRLWWQSGLLIGALQLLVGYAIQGLWALPIYAWLLLVSARVNRNPLLWAVLLPVFPIILERAILGSSHLSEGIGKHLSFAALPGLPDPDPGLMEPAITLADQLALLATAELWTGLVVAAVGLYGAVYCRQRYNEI